MYYHSGVDRASFIEILAREGAAGMVNASVATQPALLAAYERWPEVPLVLDSGAFQGNEDLDGYADIVRQVGWRFLWCANLDVIGNQEESDRNWLRLRNELKADVLWVYQVEGGKAAEHLGQMITQIELSDESSFVKGPPLVGIGGLVPVLKRNVKDALRIIERCGQQLYTTGQRAHFFGVSSAVVIAEFGKEPWFASADSQTWLCGFKARELLTRDGRRINAATLGLELTREECAAQNVRQIHAWMSGRPIQFSMMCEVRDEQLGTCGEV
jgi:hypothetical protein